ncbi:MAG: RloB domain-containing protein [Sphaerochaetaceae bacterium]
MARKKLTRSPNSTILIVTSNQSSALYFSQMRKDCRYSNLNVEWCDKYKDLVDFINQAARLRSHGNYTVVWALFDFDDMHATADEVKAVLSFAEQRKVNLAWNNPSQSLWYLLHFQTPIGVVSESRVIDDALANNFVPHYKTGAEYLLTDGLSFHLSLFPNKSKAANNASSYNAMAEKATGLAATNLILLFNDITRVCGPADVTHNQRQLGLKKN